MIEALEGHHHSEVSIGRRQLDLTFRLWLRLIENFSPLN